MAPLPKPKPTARRRRPAEVRSLLLDAAAHEFAAHGYAAATKKDIAARAGVALSVLDRHFESKAALFSEALVVPFVELLEHTSRDWLRQRDAPLPDAPLMHVVLGDMLQTFGAHAEALRGLAVARDALSDEIVERVRTAFEDLIGQLRLMAELEAQRRQWFSPEGLDLTLRFLIGMALGTTSYDWMLLPDDRPDDDTLLDEMSKVALWGLARSPPG